MSRERGQALIELIAGFPAVLVCALVIVDCGVAVRDRLAVSHAASAAAAAQLEGRNVRSAARAALPRSMTRSMRVRVEAGSVEVRASSSLALIDRARPVRHVSRVETEPGGSA